jgi:hypothetical protein
VLTASLVLLAASRGGLGGDFDLTRPNLAVLSLSASLFPQAHRSISLSLSLSQLHRTKVAPDLLLVVCGGGMNMGFGVGFDDGCFGRVMDLVVWGFWI